jgi:LacI family transcriptional regulator/LacI family purine nucleotide synthesis repressor
MATKPTIKDVAKRAAVSKATVSYVLNNNPDQAISDAVKKRVWDAAYALNYHPAAVAVGLARRRSRNIGVILQKDNSAIVNPFYSFIIQGIVDETMEQDYNLLFSHVGSTYPGHRSLPKIIREANVAGVIFVSRIYPRMVHDIQESGIPVVAIDPYPSARGIDSVQIDNYQGGKLAADFLVGLGHQHFVFFGRVSDRPSIVQRCEGFVRELARHGVSFSRKQDIVSCSQPVFPEGYARGCELLRRKREVTAVFCASDLMAAGLLRAAHEQGRSVPNDLSVVGFDDIMMSNYTAPPLTTVYVPKQQMGRLGVARLLEMVERRTRKATKAVVPVELLVRGSTAPCTVAEGRKPVHLTVVRARPRQP